MTRYERDIMTDNNITPDLMEQIGKYLKQKLGKYLKQKRRASTLPRKQTNVMSKELLDDIMSFVDENPNATMDDIVNDFGTPEEYENQLYENESDHEVEKIKQRIKFRKIILIAAILMVTIIGIVYASAFVIQNKDAPGTYEEIKQDESVSYANIEGVE